VAEDVVPVAVDEPGPTASPAPDASTSPARVRARLARLGFTPRADPPTADSTLVFEAQRPGLRAELRARFRNRVLWHAFYSVEGDSAAVQRDLDRAVAALTAQAGAPATDDAGRTWTLPDGRRVALPKAPARLENGRYGYAVAMQRL